MGVADFFRTTANQAANAMGMSLQERPEAIIITVSAAMIGANGYRHWLRNFLDYMNSDGVYSFRLSNQPKHKPQHVYLCIGGKIRFKTLCVQTSGKGIKVFDDGRQLFGKAWVMVCGPVTRPRRPIPRKGFQGFRYTPELF